MSESDHGQRDGEGSALAETPIVYVRVQRYDTPDRVTFAAVRQDDLASVLDDSNNVETVQECELSLPPEISATLAARLYAAGPRPVRARIGDVADDSWITGDLKGKRRPPFWRPGHPPVLATGYRCTYRSPDGWRCDMYGVGTGPCPAHQPGTRWDV